MSIVWVTPNLYETPLIIGKNFPRVPSFASISSGPSLLKSYVFASWEPRNAISVTFGLAIVILSMFDKVYL